MPRVLYLRNYGVYVHDERSAPHHRPHAHVKLRGRRVASIFLETRTLFDVMDRVPDDLLELIADHQNELLDEWERLNND